MPYDVWHVLAADDSEARQATRTATAVANKRVKDQFGKFLATDTEARFEFVKDEIEKLVLATAEEYDADSKPILDGILASLTATARGPQNERVASVTHEARRPKLCPYHSEVMDISLAEGSPRAGFDAMAQHAWGPKHCKGDEYEGSKCNFKKEFTTQSFWDERAEQAEQRRQEREDARAEDLVVDEITEDDPELIEDAPVEEPVAEDDNVVEVDFGGEVDGEPSAVGEGAPEELAVAASTDAPLARSADLRKEAPGGQHREEWGEGGSKRNRQYEHILESCKKEHPDYDEARCKELAAATTNKTRSEHGETKDSAAERIAEALQTVDVEKDDSLNFNRERKRPSGPEDTEGEGSPHPTVTIDPTEPIVYKDDESPFEGTNAVLEKQDVEKKDEVSNSGQGGTFPKGDQANPVASVQAAIEKMGLTARDFVAIAHILATNPSGPDPQLAEHFAQYLANTNPAFDYERFIAAAGGTPQTGRDNYRDQYGPNQAIPGQPVASAPDVTKNPVREILNEDDFLPDEVVARLAQ